jgi:hypothetical protein
MTSRTFATLFVLTALAAVALLTSARADCTASNGTSVATGGTQGCAPPATGSEICLSNGNWDNSACTVAPARCLAFSGALVAPGGTQPCTPPSTGSGQVCKSNGTWDNSACTIGVAPPPPPGWCGSAQEGVVHACPAGTSCKARRITAPRPWYCPVWIFIPFFTPPEGCRTHELVTTDWFCDP